MGQHGIFSINAGYGIRFVQPQVSPVAVCIDALMSRDYPYKPVVRGT